MLGGGGIVSAAVAFVCVSQILGQRVDVKKAEPRSSQPSNPDRAPCWVSLVYGKIGVFLIIYYGEIKFLWTFFPPPLRPNFPKRNISNKFIIQIIEFPLCLCQ